jgi:hypothetical protein
MTARSRLSRCADPDMPSARSLLQPPGVATAAGSPAGRIGCIVERRFLPAMHRES